MRIGENIDEIDVLQAAADREYQTLYEDASWLRTLAAIESQSTNVDEIRTLRSWQRLFRATAIEDEAARAFSQQMLADYLAYSARRAKYEWGYEDPKTGAFVESTANALPNIISTHPDEATRKAAYNALLKYERFIFDNGFLDLVRSRNTLAHMLGYNDFYECETDRYEGLAKKDIFSLLDEFERKTRANAKNAIDAFVREHGESAREPWNFPYLRSGSLKKERDPYLQFEDALERWVRSFSALGIRFRGASLTLDLCDRAGKYENGFMHLPYPAHDASGTWQPARINFCAHAIPNEVGMGEHALNTLFHEGGHAAHFANIAEGDFTYSMSPMAHGCTETQSMFCDRMLDDADWLTRYANMPMSLIERSIELEQQFSATVARRILPISYFERALYELPDSELTTENVIELAHKTERDIWFLTGATKPILSATHPQDNPCMAHGYLLALMAVHQTREYFQEKYGHILDNPNVGRELSEAYWEHGNAKPFYEMVQDLTGKPFSADALVREVTKSEEDAFAEAKSKVARLPEIPEPNTTDLDAHIHLIHGAETIAEFSNGSFEAANQQFKAWVRKNYPKRT